MHVGPTVGGDKQQSTICSTAFLLLLWTSSCFQDMGDTESAKPDKKKKCIFFPAPTGHSSAHFYWWNWFQRSTPAAALSVLRPERRAVLDRILSGAATHQHPVVCLRGQHDFSCWPDVEKHWEDKRNKPTRQQNKDLRREAGRDAVQNAAMAANLCNWTGGSLRQLRQVWVIGNIGAHFQAVVRFDLQFLHPLRIKHCMNLGQSGSVALHCWGTHTV